MAPSNILTPGVLAAFARAKTVAVQLQEPSVVPRTACVNGIASCCLPLFSASRALMRLFGNIFLKLNDRTCLHVSKLPDHLIHRENASPSLYESYKAIDAKDETVAVLIDEVNEGPGAVAAAQDDQKEEKADQHDKPLTSHEEAAAAVDVPVLYTNETSPQSLSATDEDEISCDDSLSDTDDSSQPFPGFIDCLCLLCQGHDVPELASDHHNTECDCHCCKPAMAAITTHEDIHMDRSVECILGHPTPSTYRTLCSSSPSEIKPPYTQSAASDDLIRHSGPGSLEGSMADSGYHDSRRTILKVQKTCEKLVILTRILEQQRAELRKPVVSVLTTNAPRNVSFHSIEESTACDNLAKTEDRGVVQQMGEQSTTRGHRKRRKTGQWWYKTRHERHRGMAKSSMRDPITRATITDQPQRALSKKEAPITPGGQTWGCLVQCMEEYLEALEKAQDDWDNVEVNGKADQWLPKGLFTVAPGSTSYTVKMRARRATYKAGLTQDFDEWIDKRIRKHANESVSPTPIKRIRTSTEWREAYRNRQAQLIPEDGNMLKRTEVVAQGRFNTAEAAHNAMKCRPKTFFGTPIVVTVPPKGWSKIGQPEQPQVHTSQHFFHVKKASRFTNILEDLAKDARQDALLDHGSDERYYQMKRQVEGIVASKGD